MLGRVIGQEKAELEEERAKLVEEVNNNEKRLKYYEDKLLACLSASKGNLIDDEELIATLADAKKVCPGGRGRVRPVPHAHAHAWAHPPCGSWCRAQGGGRG